MKKEKLTFTKYLLIILISYGAYSCSSNSPDGSDDDDPVIVDNNDDDGGDDGDDGDGDNGDNIEYTTVNTIQEFIGTLNQNDVNIKLAPGTYRFGPDDITSGLIPYYEMFVFRGNNSNYDFTDVKFEFETELWSSYGSFDIRQLRLLGDNITLKNLTIEDIGMEAPTKRAQNILLDGTHNTIEGFTITARGSYPYGYGDVFGKGGNSVINHRKHSVLLIRGENNTLKNTKIYSRTYGHVVFIQGGKDVLIEDCYVEGDAMRTTDDILAEVGTGTPADNVNFLTVWGYTLPPGYMVSMQEAGFRSYASAEHYSGNGETSTTENVTIRNCTAKRVRSGFNLVFGGGTMIMENCTSIENEQGFSIQSGGQIINCKSDAKYGTALTYAYDSDNDISATIELTNNDGSYGPHPIAYIGGGSGQNITFTSNETNVPQDRYIQLGGAKGSIRHLEGANSGQDNQTIRSSTIRNNTNFPVKLTSSATGNTIVSCGTVTDEGTTNSITQTTCD